MAGLLSDLQGAFRGLLRNPSVFALSAVCLALGIGSCASMLELLDTLLFRPPAHVVDAGSLRRVAFHDTFPGVGEFTSDVTSYPVFLDLGKARALAGIGAFESTDISLGRGQAAKKVRAVLATPGFLHMLGVEPVQGRLFSEAEGRPGSPGLVALLGYDFWRRGYGGADILGRQLEIGRHRYTVLGVLPSRFIGTDLRAVDVWLPISAEAHLQTPEWADHRGAQFLQVLVRLRAGVAPSAVEEELTALFRAGAAEAGRPKPAARVGLEPLLAGRGPDAPPAVRVALWLAGISWIVLLISCANVASLLVLRGLDRKRELSLRLAFGASAGRLARLMLFEGIVLAFSGGAAALLIFLFTRALFQRLILPEAAPPDSSLDLRTLLLLAALTLLAALLSGAVPALWVRRSALFQGIREGVRESGPSRSRLNTALCAGQIALVFVLIASAGGFLRSLLNVFQLDLGLEARRVLVATVDLENGGEPAEKVDALYHRFAQGVARLPGVDGVSLGATIPFATSWAGSLSVPGLEQLPELSTGGPYLNAVSSGFFRTTGTTVLRGRDFSPSDRRGSAPVAIVNQTMARVLWPGRDALGQCLQIGGKSQPCSTIVAVVEDARREALQEEPTLQYYVPLGQAPKRLSTRALFVRSSADPETLVPAVRREMQSLVPDLPYVEIQSLASLLDPQIHPWRMGAAVLTLLGLLALTLAVIGLYAVLAHSMARRTYELAVRAALGAQWRHVSWLALRQGLGIAALGAAAGLVLMIAAVRRLQPLLFQVSASDPLSLAGAAGVVVALALFSGYTSARRVRRIDPAKALRVE